MIQTGHHNDNAPRALGRLTRRRTGLRGGRGGLRGKPSAERKGERAGRRCEMMKIRRKCEPVKRMNTSYWHRTYRQSSSTLDNCVPKFATHANGTRRRFSSAEEARSSCPSDGSARRTRARSPETSHHRWLLKNPKQESTTTTTTRGWPAAVRPESSSPVDEGTASHYRR